jgi:predicted phosphoribosyltransferase
MTDRPGGSAKPPPRFADLADGGRALIDPLREALADSADPLLVAVLPNGVPVAVPLAEGLGLALVGVSLDRTGDPRVIEVPDVTGRNCVVVDDGVETGTAAQLVGLALRDAGAARVLLAVPVCPRQAQAQLQHVYDRIVAVDRPLGRRDLRWHYRTFDTIDEAEARRRLDAR